MADAKTIRNHFIPKLLRWLLHSLTAHGRLWLGPANYNEENRVAFATLVPNLMNGSLSSPPWSHFSNVQVGITDLAAKKRAESISSPPGLI